MSARLYKSLHWGHPGRGETLEIDAPDPRQGPRAVLGELISVTYRTIKGRDGEVTDFEHKFGPARAGVWSEERPLLVVVQRDRLVIAGGAYRVREEGIVG